jgi:isoquinoline 1-oxidoreductase beta subunit
MSALEPLVALDRRTFIKTAVSAGALLVAVPLGWRPAHGAPSKQRPAEQWCVYVEIRPDNTVSMASPVMEMGQFMRTTGPMMLAEEMDLDWSLVSFTFDQPISMQRDAKGEVGYDMRRSAPAAA